MNMHDLPSKIEFIAWDQRGEPAYLADRAALARWGQRQTANWMPVWFVDHERCQVVKLVMIDGHNGRWQLDTDAGVAFATIEHDPSNDPRTLMVVDYFEAKVGMNLARPQRVALDDWDFFAPSDQTRTWAPFGVMPPEDNRVRYCPDVIAEQTLHLNDLEFDFYLATLDVRVSLSLVHCDLDPFERERLIESATFDMGHDNAAMVNEVHMRALDARQA